MKHLNILKLVLTLLFLGANFLHAQKEMINKHVLSRTSFKQLSGDLMLRDRFGNLYHPNEVLIRKKQSTTTTTTTSSPSGAPASMGILFPSILDTCKSGMFQLYFVDEPIPGTGFSVAAHRDVICEVFKDISRLIENQSGSNVPYVKILIASDTSISMNNSGLSIPSGVNIVGTSFEPVKYNLKNAWMDNIIYASIKNGKSAYINLLGIENMLHNALYDYTHGLLIVNFKNKTWYTNFNDTSGIPSTQDDLYTHTLQQALHMLGLSSNALESGIARGGNNLYSRYDNHLFKNSTSNKLFTYSSSTRLITNTTTIPIGCPSPNDIRFIGGSSNIHVYNDTPWKANINLSNFSCSGSTCNTSYAKPSNNYVMVPCLQSGHTYIKRHPHQDEVYALCDLGYKLKAVGGVYAYGANISNNSSQGNVYKTYTSCSEPCIAVGGHDTIKMAALTSCSQTFAPKILTNDIPTTSVIARMELLDTTVGTLVYSSTGFTFTPKPHFKYGEVRLVYFPQCTTGAQLGSVTYITILYPYPPLPPCADSGECNYICYGTFEETDNPHLWHGFLIHEPDFDYNTADLWHSTGAVTCRRNVVDNYWADCNVVDTGCNFKSYGVHPHVNGGNQFMGIYAQSGASVYTEGFHFKLKKPIFRDTTKRLKLNFLAKVFNGCSSSFKMLVVADDTLPQAPPNPIRPRIGTGRVRTCVQYCDTVASANITSDTWAHYSIPFKQPKAGDSFTDIIIMSDVPLDTSEPTVFIHYCYFDNFELYDSLDTRAVISSNPHNLIPCNDTTQTIEYYVCLENSLGSNSDSIIVQVNLPYGFNIAAGSDFNASGRYKIPAGAISNTLCDTLRLKYTIDYTKVATDRGHTITAGYTCAAYCSSEISDWVKVYPKNHAISVSKTVNKPNPVVGDTIRFDYVVCNVSPLNISDLEFLDTFPNSLSPYLTNIGPTLSGQILSYQLSLDSAFNLSNPRCIQFSCEAIVKSNCKLPTRAHVRSIANPCFKAQVDLTLNAAISASPIIAAIKPPSAIWCGNNIPLQAVITNPSGSYTYQWLKDGTNVGANTANHLATSNGLYSVKISQNGCSTVIEGKAFDTSFIVNSSFTHTKCTANIGSIFVTPINSLKPYTYAWSGSAVKDSFRIGLSNGSYTVTVTDSIGCNKVLSFTINRLYDTLKINKTITQPICTSHNGTIKILSNGGTAPYNFQWNGGSTLSDTFNLSAGNYYVTVTDVNGCSIKDTIVLTKTNFTISVNDSTIKPQCNLSTGSIYLKPSGGYSTYYTYLWSNAITQSSIVNIPAGSYSVTVTDTMGCLLIDTFLVPTVDTFLNILDTVINPKCFGNLNGSISLNPQGGTPPYRYLWNSGSALPKRTGLPSGIYSVTITDTNGCRAEKSYIFQNPPEIFATSYGCYSYCDTPTGCAGMNVVSGRAPFKYLWLDGDTSTYRENLPIGEYQLYIKDSMGCQSTLFSYYVDNLGSYYGQNMNFIETVLHKCSSTIDLKAPSFPDHAYWWSTGDVTQTIYNVTPGDTFVLAIYDTSGGSCYFLDTITPVGKLDIGLGTLYPNASSLTLLLSDTISNPGHNTIKYQGFNVVGRFDIDVNMWFEQCNFEVASGVGIHHSNPGTDLVIESCHLYSCGTDLWQGILNYGQNNVSIYRSTIEDALYGLEVIEGDFNVFETHFNYNYVGIYVNPDPSFNYLPNYTTSWHNIGGCHFLGHQNKLIKNPYPGIGVNGIYSLQHPSAAYVGTSWAGIIIADRVFSLPKSCSFKNLTNGILAYNIQNSMTYDLTFDSINGNSSIGNTAVNGVCYYGNSNIPHPWIRPIYSVFTWNLSATVSSTFQNSDIGVRINNGGHIQMEHASMENILTGVECTNVWSTTLNYSNISSQNQGIKVVNNVVNGFNSAKHSCINRGSSYPCKPGIYNNTIVNTGTNNAHGAIELQHTNWLDTFYYNYTVAENTIDLHGRNGFGVYVANLKANDTQSHSRISMNQLFMHNPTTTFKGMHFANNNSMRISLNQVGSTNPNASMLLAQYPIAMHFEKTEANIICNEVTNTHLGMGFTDNCTKTNFEKNHFQDHYGGLVLDGSSFLQNQNNKGNTWTGSYGIMRAARNDQPFTNTKFKVGLGAPLECNPPSRQPLAFFSAGGSGDNPSCQDVTYSAPPQGYDGAYLQQQTAEYPEYKTALNYQREAALYRDLKAIESSLAPNSAEKNYINQRANTNINRFLDIEKQATQLFTFSASDRLQCDVLDHQGDTYLDSLRKLLAELNAMPHAQQQSHRQSIASLTQQLYMTKVYKHQLLEPIYQSGQSQSNQLVQLNDAIEPINQSERLQKQFNALYLPTYAIGNTMLTAEQKEQYRILANQCPRINGDVVFRSRAIMSAQEASVYYDDTYICDTTSHSVKHEQPTNPIDSPYCTFAPNPAHTQALISFKDIPNEDLIIRLLTLEGLVIYESTNYVTTPTFTIPTASIQNGLYLIQIVSIQNNQTLYGGQIQILHE